MGIMPLLLSDHASTGIVRKLTFHETSTDTCRRVSNGLQSSETKGCLRMIDGVYWTQVRDVLEDFSSQEKIEKFLFNTADFAERINVIFDDLDVQRRTEALPDHFSDVRSFCRSYFEHLDRLIGDGCEVTRDAAIYDADERRSLFERTRTLMDLLTKMIASS